MSLNSWLKNKIISSTTITQYTTEVWPEKIPQGRTPPCIVYKQIGYDRNSLEQNTVYSLSVFHNSIGNTDLLNDQLYNLFDTSTAYIRESSSNLHIDSVSIINNIPGLDPDNDYWFKILDISVWYHINK